MLIAANRTRVPQDHRSFILSTINCSQLEKGNPRVAAEGLNLGSSALAANAEVQFPTAGNHQLHLLPRTHAQGIKQSVLSVICLSVIVTKITRSRVLHIYACCNYHELVEISEKLVSVHFELLDMAH